LEQELALSIRKMTWLPLDEVWETLLSINSNITRSSIYRAFCRNEINRVLQKEREKAKKFKEYLSCGMRILFSRMNQDIYM